MAYEGHFTSRNGLDFYERRWDAAGTARANLVLIHGYGEHCSRYEHVAHALNERGIAVHSYDQRGYGKSPGRRAYIKDFEILLEDLDTFMDHIWPKLEGLPWFGMGHSMGGMVLAAYAQTRRVDARGLIFSSPFLAFAGDVPKILLRIAGVLGIVAPWLPVGRVENTGLSRDPAVVAVADNDPLGFHGRVRARTGAQFNKAIRRITARFDAITLPVYILHGSADAVVSCEGSKALHERCGSEDKTLNIVEGGYHELWNDLCKDEVITSIGDWILARL